MPTPARRPGSDASSPTWTTWSSTTPVPQESGHRAELRELLLPGLAVTATRRAGKLPGFALRAHDVAEVTAAAHPYELPRSTATHLYLDAQQHGLGSRSCGPDVRPEYQLRPRAAAWSLTFAAR